MKINKKQIAAYTLLPQVFPRFNHLVSGGFAWLAYLIAHIYYAVRLLPVSHPYLRPENKGRYGIRHVIAAAANNLRFEIKYIDQLLIFAIIVVGFVLLISQILLVIAGFIFTQANAAPGLFETVNHESDAAFMLLDFVFGVPGFFESCALGSPDTGVATIAPCTGAGGTPPPAFGDAPVFAYHEGLHSLLEFYSWSLLFVGILILLYFIVIIIAETASTGVPFGARFNTAWGPIRLLVAIGLLIPIAYGLNSAQYLTLAIAKLGSGLATNAWFGYNDTVAAAYGANPNPGGYPAGILGSNNEPYLPQPVMSDASPFIAAIQLVRACEYLYMKDRGFTNRTETTADGDVPFQRIRPWIVKPGADPLPLTNDDNNAFSGVTVTAGTPPTFTSSGGGNPFDDYDAVLQFYDYGDVVIRFGAPKPEIPAEFDPNTIVPYCGEITLPTTTAVPILESGGDPAGAWFIQKEYFRFLIEQWLDERNGAHAARYAETQSTGIGERYRPCMITAAMLETGAGFNPITVLNFDGDDFVPPAAGPNVACALPPGSDERTDLFNDNEVPIENAIQNAWNAMLTVDELYLLEPEVRERGWAGAGMWYNRLAFVIGREFDAAANTPFITRMPSVMNEVRRLRGGEDLNVSATESYNPYGISDDESLEGQMLDRDIGIGYTLYNVYKDWQTSGIAADSISIMADQNLIESVMHGIFGTERLMKILEEEAFNVHPMAQLIAIGKDLVNSTLVSVIASVGFSVGSGIFEASGQASSAGVASALSGAFSAIALIGLTAGFLLFYVLPFMPFLYFFFAVGTWVKTIFEAMVGVPLWALAHIRIDREGLPGDAAANGYFLLLEIFVRPILIVFALIASFVIFGAMVRVLHEVFDLVVQNVTGFDEDEFLGGATPPPFIYGEYTPELQYKRSIIDEFFFTIIYVMTVYMIGLSSFKLIDFIPDSILRWAGAGVSSFGDKYQDPAESLTQYAAIGGYVVGRQALGGARQAGGALGQAMGRGGARLPDMPMFQNEAALRARAADVRAVRSARARGVLPE